MNGEKAKADAEDQAAAELASQQRNRARIVAHTSTGRSEDVTEQVVTILDAINNSLDWGSGFLNREDLVAWQALARLLDFEAERLREVAEQITKS